MTGTGLPVLGTHAAPNCGRGWRSHGMVALNLILERWPRGSSCFCLRAMKHFGKHVKHGLYVHDLARCAVL